MSLSERAERLITLWALAGGLLLLLIVLATAINAAGFTIDSIAGLWGENFPGLSGYEDGVTLLVGAAALAMFPYCQMHGGHAVVDVFMQYAPRWANKAVFNLSAILTVMLAVFLAYMLIQGVQELKQDNVETAVLAWPVWVFAATSVVSCLLWALSAVLQMIARKGF